jgi:hypothetical protein
VASLRATASIPEKVNRIPERERQLSADQDELKRARECVGVAEALVDYRQETSDGV